MFLTLRASLFMGSCMLKQISALQAFPLNLHELYNTFNFHIVGPNVMFFQGGHSIKIRD